MADPPKNAWDSPSFVPMQNPYGGKGPLMMGITWSFATIAIILMGLRTYTNAYIIKRFTWDYYFAILTLATGLVAQSLLTVGCSYGLGNHLVLLTEHQLVFARKWAWITQMTSIQAIGFGKLAVIAFLLRIDERINNKRAWFLYFVGFSNVIINIDQTSLMGVVCSPLAKWWDASIPGECPPFYILRTNYVGYFQGSWSATSDVVLAIYPTIVYRNLKISRRVKISLFVLMGGGVLAGISSAVKTYNIKLIGVSKDNTYAISTLIIWGFTELWLVLILGSFPPLRNFFIRVSQQLTAATSRSRNITNGYHSSKTDKAIPMYPSKRSQGNESHESAEYIISDDAGIMKTTDIHVTRGGKDKGVSDEDLARFDRSPV